MITFEGRSAKEFCIGESVMGIDVDVFDNDEDEERFKLRRAADIGSLFTVS